MYISMHGKFQNDENLVTFSSFLLSLHIHILELLDGPENSSGDVGRVVKVDSGKFPHRPGFDLGADPVVHDGSAGNDQAQGNDHVADVHPRNSGEDRGGGVVRDCSRGGLSSTIFGVVVDHVVLQKEREIKTINNNNNNNNDKVSLLYQNVVKTRFSFVRLSLTHFHADRQRFIFHHIDKKVKMGTRAI